jgi:TPR repeat protein
MMFALGQGVEADLVQAHKWVSLAAGQGNEDAQTALKQLVTKLTPEQLAESSKLANEWQDKRAPQSTAQIPPPEAPKTAEK